MQIIRTMAELEAKIAECNDALTHQSDDAMRALFNTFSFDFSAAAPSDPFDPAYAVYQMSLHAALTGRSYDASRDERTLFLVDEYEHRPFPFYLQSPVTAGNHLLAIGFLLRTMTLAPGSRVLEFGPGWGNTTIALAQLGMQVTAVDVEPNFCEILRRRAARHSVEVEVVEGDFFWAEQVSEPYDAVVFFESFHHCADHMRLLRALRRAVKPGGQVYFGAEPILADYAVPWGVRTDGEALWAMRNFGWLELGFRESYFRTALTRTGWRAEKRTCLDADWVSVWVAHRHEVVADAVEERAISSTGEPAAPTSQTAVTTDGAKLSMELDAMYASTSWRITSPLRAFRRLLGSN